MTAASTLPTAPAESGKDDPYLDRVVASPIRFLYRINPLAKLAAVVPAMIGLVFVRDLTTPLALLALAYAVLLVGVRFTGRLVVILALAVPATALVLGVGFSLWTDAALVSATPVVVAVGPWTLHAGALQIGLATGLRLAALFTLPLIAGLSTTGPDLVRASVQQLRVPYRVGYTALAAIRFVPRFGHELDLIRQAHRVRGSHGGRGPLATLTRAASYIVPLLAGAIRHAERVALAMDARAFGAHPDRTERHLVPWRGRDTVFALAFWALSLGILFLARGAAL